MHSLHNKVSFSLVKLENNWRSDLSLRFCEYFSWKLNGASFKDRISLDVSIDAALQKCNSEYLVVICPGGLIFSESFFEHVENHFQHQNNFILANIEISDDYIIINEDVIVFHMERWKNAGCPKFYGNIRTAPVFKVVEHGKDSLFPHAISITNENNHLVTNFCAMNGAEIVVKQLQQSQTMVSAKKILVNESFYFISKKTPHDEIYTESFFEKKLLPTVKKKIFTTDTDEYADIRDLNADVIITTAQGLKAFNLLNYTGATRAVVYDHSPMALEFQKRIFSVEEPTLFGDIITQFMKDYPSAVFDNSWQEEEFTLIQPLELKDVKFILLDIFTFEAKDFAALVDLQLSAVFDFSDIFIYPYNFYKRPLYQVQSLFSELFSALKSRLGPTFILGYAPGWQNMNSIPVNTFKYEFKEVKLTVYEEETEKEISEFIATNKMFVPSLSKSLSEDSVEMDCASESTDDDITDDRVKRLRSKSEELGYTCEIKNVTAKKVKFLLVTLTKLQQFNDFNGIYEYTYDSNTQRWSFKVSKYGKDKKVEFANGIDVESLITHLAIPAKINPKTAVKVL